MRSSRRSRDATDNAANHSTSAGRTVVNGQRPAEDRGLGDESALDRPATGFAGSSPACVASAATVRGSSPEITLTARPYGRASAMSRPA
jgi:hypothetical protein